MFNERQFSNEGGGGSEITEQADWTLDPESRLYYKARVDSFLPTDIYGCNLWLDASQITGLTDGDAISTWSDESGESNDATQSTSTYQPTYQTNELNGKPVVRFDTDFMIVANESTFDLATPTIFLVCTPRTVIAKNDSSTYNSSHRKMEIKVHADEFLYGSGGDGVAVTVTQAISGFNTISTTTISNTNHRLTINGEIFDFTDTLYDTSFNNKPVTIGRSFSNVSTEYRNGDIAEIIIYDSALSDTDREKVETYLSGKYAITI